MAFEFKFQKVVNPAKLAGEIKASTITVALDFISTDDDVVLIVFVSDLSPEEETTLSDIVAAHDPGDPFQDAQRLIARYRTFANGLVNEFAAENIVLALTTDEIRSIMKNIPTTWNNLLSGELLVAIVEIDELPESAGLDAARKLKYSNKIRTFLGIPEI